MGDAATSQHVGARHEGQNPCVEHEAIGDKHRDRLCYRVTNTHRFRKKVSNVDCLQMYTLEVWTTCDMWHMVEV